MTTQELIKAHGAAKLFLTQRNNNGTAWYHSTFTSGSTAKYEVLVGGFYHNSYEGTTLQSLHDQADVLEVSVDGVTVY